MLLDSIESGARRGSMIVRQLMTFARAQPVTKVPVSLPTVLDNVASLIRETFLKDIILELVPTVSFPAGSTILGDLPQLQQALLNLALNAADAMPRGGRLVLALSHADISPAEAAREPDATPGPHAVLTVADHGTGIATEHLDKIFDPFFTTKPFGQGSGLGLSVVLGVVHDLGGFVRVTSRPGVGTIFKLHFPLHLPSETAAPAVAGGSASPLRPSERATKTVLVVDDETPVREIIRMILSRENFDILCADGADAAFSQIQSCHGRVDLILTDLCMPGVSGATFVERLRKRHPHLPVVILTGTDSPRDFPDSLRERVQGVLTKPFDAATLLATVRRHLEASPAPQPAEIS
jgi:CheY-like chemotaxis protein